MSDHWIEMYHPEADVKATVLQSSFEELWSENGWVLHEEEEVLPFFPEEAPALSETNKQKGK